MSLASGTQFGPYQIVAQLGSGGMGVVYQAHDPRLDWHVAIKLLPPDLTRDETAKQRFLQEAKAASALDHPNICNIHEINETDDAQLYLVMAHYEGETLKDRIARGPLDLNDAIEHRHAGWPGTRRGPRRRYRASGHQTCQLGFHVDTAQADVGVLKNVRRRNLAVRRRCRYIYRADLGGQDGTLG